MTIRIALCLAVLAASSARAQVEPSGARLLAEALKAPKVNCAGTVSVSTRGGKAKKLCVWYAPGGRFRRDLLDSRANVVRTAVSDGGASWLYDRGRRAAWRGAPDAATAGPLFARDDEAASLLRNYSVVLLAGGARVAGRPCRVLEVRSPAGAVVRKVWIDRQQGVSLQMKAYGADGGVSSSVRFLSVEFPPKLNEDLFRFSPPDGATVIPSRRRPGYLSEDSPRAGVLRPLLPAWIPPGFVLEGSEAVEYRGTKVLHSRYSDGLEGLSVFQFPGNLRVDPSGLGERRLERRRGGRTFVFIGRLPDDVLRRMADSLP